MPKRKAPQAGNRPEPVAAFHRLVIERFRRIGALPVRKLDWETQFLFTHVFGGGNKKA